MEALAADENGKRYDFIFCDIFEDAANNRPREVARYTEVAEQILKPGGELHFYEMWGTHKYYPD